MRMWEIRENTGKYDKDYRYGYRDKSTKEAYECGYEDGYKAAMEELEEDEEKEGYRYPDHVKRFR